MCTFDESKVKQVKTFLEEKHLYDKTRRITRLEDQSFGIPVKNTPDFRNDTIGPIVILIMQIYRQIFASAAFRNSVYETGCMDVIGGIFGNETPVSNFVLHPRGKSD